MKIIFLHVFMLSFLFEGFAQNVEFYYDAAGNRKQRKVLFLKTEAFEETGNNNNTAGSEVTSAPELRSYDDIVGERKIVIYPNPTRGMIQIDFQEGDEIKNARLLLYDMQGRLLQHVNAEQSNTLDLTQYPAGMYIMQMIESDARNEWKIVKE